MRRPSCPADLTNRRIGRWISATTGGLTHHRQLALDTAAFYRSYAKSQVASAFRRLWRMSSDVTDFVPSPPTQTQLVLDLPAPPATAETPLLPVRMVNEYVYWPRLAFLEWVDGEWADSGDTEEGRRAHVRVDSGGGKLPAPQETDAKPDFVARAV